MLIVLAPQARPQTAAVAALVYRHTDTFQVHEPLLELKMFKLGHCIFHQPFNLIQSQATPSNPCQGEGRAVFRENIEYNTTSNLFAMKYGQKVL